MTSLVLFETTESVIEVLWDIALALFIVRLAFIYFVLNFTSGILVSYFAYTRLTPVAHLTAPQSEYVVIPIVLMLSALWARYLITAYEIPRVLAFRLAIGGLALLFTVLAELLAGFTLYEQDRANWIFSQTDRLTAGLAFAALLAAYMLMPALLMVFERKADTPVETLHGHEKKTVADALPSVNVSEKEEKMQ